MHEQRRGAVFRMKAELERVSHRVADLLPSINAAARGVVVLLNDGCHRPEVQFMERAPDPVPHSAAQVLTTPKTAVSFLRATSSAAGASASGRETKELPRALPPTAAALAHESLKPMAVGARARPPTLSPLSPTRLRRRSPLSAPLVLSIPSQSLLGGTFSLR